MTALAGLRVLDLTRLLPGPFCTQLLADLGADVIKIEEPSGDPARYYPPLHEGTGALFLLVNRNKRSIVIDLKTAAGRQQFLALAERADVVVESFRPGVMDRLGVGYAVLSERNPRLIYASLSGFGRTGPYRDRAGHDLNYIALAGLLQFNVDADRVPVMPAVQVADLGAATFAAVGILAAVIARQGTGRGQVVDVSLYASALAWLPTLLGNALGGGVAPRPAEPMLAGGLAQYAVYKTADGRFVTLGALEPRFLANFLDAVGRSDLVAADQDTLRAALTDIFAAHTLEQWTTRLTDVDTCFAPVYTLEEAIDDPHAQALERFTSVAHDRFGALGQIAPPFDLSETPAVIRRPPPDLGEHTAEIVAELGLEEGTA